MCMDRRAFVGLAAAGLAGGLLPDETGGRPASRIEAVAFDAFPIFDPRPVTRLAEELFPEKGAALIGAWRTRQFEYTWLRVAGRRYADFWVITEEALRFAAQQLSLELGSEARQRLMEAHLHLPLWPDARPALEMLHGSGLRLAFLSNFTPRMLRANIESAGIRDLIATALSTDLARTYKPAPEAYQLGVNALRLPKEKILFVAFAGWDAAGASWFGYPTYWVNRLQLPAEQLGTTPEGASAGLDSLVEFLSQPARLR